MSPNPQETANLVTFTEEILNGKFPFLCSIYNIISVNDETNKILSRDSN